MLNRYIIAGVAFLALSACGKSDQPATDTAPTDAAAAVVAVALSGEEIFKRCVMCHKVGANAVNGIGPQMNGIVGRKIGSVEGYSYSKTLQTKGGNWDVAALDGYIASPAKYAPGTKMAFAGIANADERKALIEYLATLK